MYTIKQISLDELKFYSHNIDQSDIDYHYNLLCSFKSPLPIVFFVNFKNFVLSHIPYVMALIKYVKIHDLDFKPYCFVISDEQFSKISNTILCEFSSNNTKSLELDLNELESTISDLTHELDMYKNELVRINELIQKSKKIIKTHPKVKFKYHKANPIDDVIESTGEVVDVKDSKNNESNNLQKYDSFDVGDKINTTQTLPKEKEVKNNESETQQTNLKEKKEMQRGDKKSKNKEVTISSGGVDDVVYNIISCIKNKSPISLPTNFKDVLNRTDNLNSLYDLCKAVKGKRRLALPNAKNKSEMIKFIVTHIKYRL